MRPYLLLALLVAVASGGGYAAFWRYHLKRFQVTAPGKFYRVAQPTEFGLEHLVRRYGIRTVVSLQLFDSRLHRGWYDFDKPDGAKESDFVRSLGARAVQWPMGDEACWPWPHAWELDEFFHLLDDPANHPVLIHCMGGRHRTGTFAALYRLEYDRWTADQAIEEMRSFSFSETVAVQELNLRTYCPRPLPDDAAWPTVAATFGLRADLKSADEIPPLAQRIRSEGCDGSLRRTFESFATSDHPYALPLASRAIADAGDPLLPKLLTTARRKLEDSTTDKAEAAAATTLIADFGSPEDQEALLAVLKREGKSAASSEFYEGLVCGLTNRYTSNRLPYLRVLLDDRRIRMSPYGRYTYEATAVGRVAAISDALPALTWSDADLDAGARAATIEWLDQRPEALKLVQLTAPEGRREVHSGDGPNEEDLSKLRR